MVWMFRNSDCWWHCFAYLNFGHRRGYPITACAFPTHKEKHPIFPFFPVPTNIYRGRGFWQAAIRLEYFDPHEWDNFQITQIRFAPSSGSHLWPLDVHSMVGGGRLFGWTIIGCKICYKSRCNGSKIPKICQ